MARITIEEMRRWLYEATAWKGKAQEDLQKGLLESAIYDLRRARSCGALTLDRVEMEIPELKKLAGFSQRLEWDNYITILAAPIARELADDTDDFDEIMIYYGMEFIEKEPPYRKRLMKYKK